MEARPAMDRKDRCRAFALPWVSLLVPIAACLVYFWPNADSWLEYDRAAVAGGQFWRVVTCHLTHFSADHLFWDAVAFAVLSVVCELRWPRAWAACLVLAALTIPPVVLAVQPEIAAYRGLSGLDSALFVLLGIQLCRESLRQGRSLRAGLAAAALTLLIAKIGFEVLSGSTLFVDARAAGFVPVPLAHGVGALAAVAAVVLFWPGVQYRRVARQRMRRG